MDQRNPLSTGRREFLQAAGAAAAITAGFTATARDYAANETIAVGLIGVGGRCRHLLGALKRVPGVNVTAVCDVWDKNLEAGRKRPIRRRSPPRITAPFWIAKTSTRCSWLRPIIGTCRSRSTPAPPARTSMSRNRSHTSWARGKP